MFGLQTKLIAGAGLLIAALFLFSYVQHLRTSNHNLKRDNITLQQDIEKKDFVIEESQRRNKVVDSITVKVDQVREENKKQYDSKISKIDNEIRTGNDREVGPLLRNFFNE